MKLQLPYAPVPENAKLLAQVCVEAAKDVSGLDLDFRPESLALVEEQIERFRADKVPLRRIASTLFCFGCYLGEVIIQTFGGRWVEVEKSPMKGLASWPLVTVLDNGSCWNPIGRVFKRFEEGPGEAIPHFFSVVKSGARPKRGSPSL